MSTIKWDIDREDRDLVEDALCTFMLLLDPRSERYTDAKRILKFLREYRDSPREDVQ